MQCRTDVVDLAEAVYYVGGGASGTSRGGPKQPYRKPHAKRHAKRTKRGKESMDASKGKLTNAKAR